MCESFLMSLTSHSCLHKQSTRKLHRSPTLPEGIGFKRERKGQVLSGGQPVSGWVGGQRQENCLNIGDANKS